MADAFTMPTVANAAAKPNATARAEAGLIVVEGTALTMPFCVKVAAGGAGDAADVERTKKAVRDRIQGIFNMAGDVFSPFNPSSDLQRCNAAPPGMAIETSAEFAEVLRLCERMHAVTGGAFDPVFAATKGARRWPGSLTVSAVASGGGKTRYTVSRPTKDVGVDLSAVSKGYCVDLMAEALAKEFAGFAVDPAKPTQHGPGSLVEWGGDIRAVGCHPSGKPWACAIPLHPAAAAAKNRSGQHASASTIDLVSAACCTSGSYAGLREGATEANGMDHLTNAASATAATGGPTRMISATAVHGSCAWADALATVVASLGNVEAAKSWAAKHATSTAEVGPVFRLMACARSDGAAQEDLLPTPPAPMPTPLVRALSDELRSALRPRVLMHVAVVVPIDGGRYFAAAASSFAAMRVSNKPPAAAAAGGVVARVAATHDSRLALALNKAADGAAVHVITVATDEPSSAAAAFLDSVRDGRLIESEDGLIADLSGVGTRTSFCVLASATEAVGDHLVAYLTAAAAAAAAAPRDGGASPPAPPQVVVGRRDNKPFAVPIPRMTARQIPAGTLPVGAMCAVVTAWTPSVRGMLATTVRNVDFTSRDPALLTFDVKDSKVDRAVFGADATHHRLHIMAGSGSQDDTLAEWFDDGATADPASQFMYVAGAATAEAASGYRLPGCPAISFAVERAVQWALAGKGGRAVVVAKPVEVEGAPTAGGSGSNLDKATPVAVARLSRFGYL